jgi:micrococcal nuclease
MRRVRLVLLSVMVVAGCRAASAAATDQASVERVVDGDTIDVRIGDRHERVRLLGIDTPEVYVDQGPPECYGPEASAFTKELLPAGAAVRLERDVVGRDDYGRLLAYVYLVGDGSLVNETLARQGFARPLTIAPNGVFAARFVAAAVAAEADDLGLWGACGG